MFSDENALRKLLSRGPALRRGSGNDTFVVAGLLGSFMAREAFGQSEIVQNGKTFELAADVGFELIESGAARVTDALGQVLEIAPEHFVIQDGQLYLLNTMYSAVGGQIMAVGDAIAASLMGLGVLGAAAGAGGPSAPKVTHESPPKGIEEVYASGDLAGGAGETTQITGTSLDDLVDLGDLASAGDVDSGEDGGNVVVETGDGKDHVVIGDSSSSGTSGGEGGSITVDTGDDDDRVTVGDSVGKTGFGNEAGDVTISTGNGEDTVTIGNSAGVGSGSVGPGGTLTVDAGAGNDSIDADWGLGQAFLNGTGGTVVIDGGIGDDNIDVGNGVAKAYPGSGSSSTSASQGGHVTINGGADNDTIVVGKEAAAAKGANKTGGTVIVNAGEGDDAVTIGTYANASLFDKTSKAGHADFIAHSSGGTLDVDLGTGTDTAVIGASAAQAKNGNAPGTINVDFGADTDVDVLTFQGSVGTSGYSGNVTVQNFGIGEDSIVIEAHDEITDLSLAAHADGVLVTNSSGTFIEFVLEGTTDPNAYTVSVNGDGFVEIA